MEKKTDSLIRRIAITGPESTGKSALAEWLAGRYGTAWVPEYAREYLDRIHRPYGEADILAIARGQVAAEEALAPRARTYLFCDTEAIVTKIWSEVKYGRCHPWITDRIATRPYDLYLLCDIDLPWEYDPLREHPDRRSYLFDLYHKELKERNLPFAVVSGSGETRFVNAATIIDGFSFGSRKTL